MARVRDQTDEFWWNLVRGSLVPGRAGGSSAVDTPGSGLDTRTVTDVVDGVVAVHPPEVRTDHTHPRTRHTVGTGGRS